MSLICQMKVYASLHYLDGMNLQLSNENDPALHSIPFLVCWYMYLPWI